MSQAILLSLGWASRKEISYWEILQHEQDFAQSALACGVTIESCVQVVPAEPQAQSFIRLEATAATTAAIHRATSLLSLALKGALVESTAPLQVRTPLYHAQLLTKNNVLYLPQGGKCITACRQQKISLKGKP